MGREGCCRQISLCVGSTRSVPATLGLPPLTGVCFPRLHCSGSWLPYMERALHCVQFQSLGYSTKARTWLHLRFVPSPARATQAARSLTVALSLGAVHPLPFVVPASVSMHVSRVHAACVYSQELASSRDPPNGCQPSRISGSLWLETGGLFAVW